MAQFNPRVFQNRERSEHRRTSISGTVSVLAFPVS